MTSNARFAGSTCSRANCSQTNRPIVRTPVARSAAIASKR
jgi:hypothetical protein